MLKITITTMEMYNETKAEFIPPVTQDLVLEHSLASISKWESKFKKPFLNREEKTDEEIREYIKCMTLNEGVDDDVYKFMPVRDVRAITKYIDDPMSATTINNKSTPSTREIITSEVIYYWMVSSTIPFECQYWHLNRLLNLITIHSIKNAPQDKKRGMSKADLLKRNYALNEARRNAMNSKG